MALEDRDWYRRESGRAFWRELDRSLGSGAPAARRAGWLSWTFIAGGAIAAVTLVSPGWYHHLRGRASTAPTHFRLASPVAVRPVLAPSPQTTVRIRWRADDVARARTAGRVCVDEPSHGRICAFYVVGERPADVLARRLRALGLTPQSVD